jgi:hypothetical protein
MEYIAAASVSHEGNEGGDLFSSVYLTPVNFDFYEILTLLVETQALSCHENFHKT